MYKIIILKIKIITIIVIVDIIDTIILGILMFHFNN